MKTVIKEEEKLIELSEQKNPYAKECPNRHLWSEGFRSGYHTASERTAKLEELVKAYEHLLDCFGITKPEKSTHIDSLDAAFKRITELTNNLK